MNHFNCPHCGGGIIATPGDPPGEPMTWIRNGHGWGWRYDGLTIVAEHPPQASANLNYSEHPGGGYVYRTNGVPMSMDSLLQDFGNDLEEAALVYGLNKVDICAMIGIEATRLNNSHFDPQCVREESGFTSDQATPNRVSSGLLQTLLSTFDSVQDQVPLAPIHPDDLIRDHLYVPRRSILGGSAYLAKQLAIYQDRVLLVGAYNAGGVYDADNVWNLRTYSDTRVDRWIAYVNDGLTLQA